MKNKKTNSNRKVASLDLKQEYAFLKNDIRRELNVCFKSHTWILGDVVTRFEAKMAQYLGVKYAIGVASGTDALFLALTALALKLKGKEFFDKKDEIVTTPFTFIATAEAIVRMGATPVFVDIDPQTFNIDASKIEKVITKNTVGIMPVHLYGLAANIKDILAIAKKHNLFVVEDVAQAAGATYENKKLGSFGDLGAFSFFPSKNLGGYGDGGLVTTSNKLFYDHIMALRNHGQVGTYSAEYLGFNSRLDSIQAAILLAKIKYLDKFNKLRQKVAFKYDIALKNIKAITLPFTSNNVEHVYNIYNIKVSSIIRDKLVAYLNSQGIASRVYYPLPLYKMKPYKIVQPEDNFKNCEEAVSQVLTLPLHPFLTNSEVNYVIKKLKIFFNEASPNERAKRVQ